MHTGKKEINMPIKAAWKWVFIETLQKIGVSDNSIAWSLKNIEEFETHTFLSPGETIDWMYDPWEFNGYEHK